MLKLLIISLSINLLNANSFLEDKILNFLKKTIAPTKSYKITNIRLTGSKEIDSMKGWKVFFVKVDLKIIGKDKNLTISDKIFTNGKVIARDLISINSGRSIKSMFVPDFDSKYYNDKNIIAGDKNAKNKLVVFSDPLCPFCMSFMPEIIKFVKKYPNQFVLYYYHFPLNIHPNSKTIIKASLTAKKMGLKDVDLKVYEKAFDFEGGKDDKKALEAFNKEMGTKFSLKDINNPEIIKLLEDDIKVVNNLGLMGTPRLFVNGKFDKTRQMYKNLVK
jgi:thiol-disulfide isomerase/thioredoxin